MTTSDIDQIYSQNKGSDENERYDDHDNNVDGEIIDYDITSTPNDFNLKTLFDFIESGAVVIPNFQRNYIWDIRRASKLIESLIRGLPVPQIFLYETDRNRFLVIDGQQRLMSLYYFIKQRFPKSKARLHLRSVFRERGYIPDETLNDDEYFTNFRLALPVNEPGQTNKFHGLSYDTLGEYQMRFNLRPIRNVIIKQNFPQNDDSSIYEIFSRLNSGGVNLRPQEIRLSLYHSPFYEMLIRINNEPEWRRLLQNPQPDLHLKDTEVLLRIFAMLADSENYAPSLVKFLNQFSKKSQSNKPEKNEYLENLFMSFLEAAKHLNDKTFINKKNGRFNIALIEAVFYATCKDRFAKHELVSGRLNENHIKELERNENFVEAASVTTTSTRNVKKRLQIGVSLIDVLEG